MVSTSLLQSHLGQVHGSGWKAVRTSNRSPRPTDAQHGHHEMDLRLLEVLPQMHRVVTDHEAGPPKVSHEHYNVRHSDFPVLIGPQAAPTCRSSLFP